MLNANLTIIFYGMGFATHNLFYLNNIIPSKKCPINQIRYDIKQVA